MKFNERLKSIRKRFKVTQKVLAEYLNITVRTYQRYEEGIIDPPIANISALAKYFNLPTDCLLGNGFFSNWEEILSHKAEILKALQETVLNSLPFKLEELNESQLARILPAICEKIIIEDNSIKVYPLISIKD